MDKSTVEFLGKAISRVEARRDAHYQIDQARQSIARTIEDQTTRAKFESRCLIADFKNFFEERNRTLWTFMDEEFCAAAYYFLNHSDEKEYVKYESLRKASTSDESFLALTLNWCKGSDSFSGGAPEWILRAQPTRWEWYKDLQSRRDEAKSVFDEGFSNTVNALPKIFDVCSSMADDYSIKISSPDGGMIANGEFELLRAMGKWVVIWNAYQITENKSIDSVQRSHSDPTIEGILDWIVNNVWNPVEFKKHTTVV